MKSQDPTLGVGKRSWRYQRLLDLGSWVLGLHEDWRWQVLTPGHPRVENGVSACGLALAQDQREKRGGELHMGPQGQASPWLAQQAAWLCGDCAWKQRGLLHEIRCSSLEQDLLEQWSIQAVVSCLWALGTKLRSSGRTVRCLFLVLNLNTPGIN